MSATIATYSNSAGEVAKKLRLSGNGGFIVAASGITDEVFESFSFTSIRKRR
jgi:hypothetical protein